MDLYGLLLLPVFRDTADSRNVYCSQIKSRLSPGSMTQSLSYPVLKAEMEGTRQSRDMCVLNRKQDGASKMGFHKSQMNLTVIPCYVE